VTQAANRGRADLDGAKSKLIAAEADERKGRAKEVQDRLPGAVVCGANASARGRVTEARLRSARSRPKAVTESTVQAATCLPVLRLTVSVRLPVAWPSANPRAHPRRAESTGEAAAQE